MKKTILPAGLTAVLLLLSLLMGTSGFAAKIEGETFDLVAENSGYQVIVPNFIELKQVEIAIGNQEPKKIWAVVMKRPEKKQPGPVSHFPNRDDRQIGPSGGSLSGHVPGRTIGQLHR